MKWNQYYKLPLRSKGAYIIDDMGQIVARWLLATSILKPYIDKINGELKVKAKFPIKRKDKEIYLIGFNGMVVPLIEVCGDEYVLSKENADMILQDMTQWLVEQLNK